MLELWTLIEELGGTALVARAFGVRPSAVSTWKRDGRQPAGPVFGIWSLARAAGIAWNPAEAASLPERPGAEARARAA